MADFLPRQAPGLTTLPLTHPVYERLASERRAGETILELPIWPGDTAWTSIYLWFVTRYRNLLINGYSPATPRAYVERVFKPLYPLDFGEMRRPQYDLLRSLGIRFIVFHEEAYPRKISDFPFRVTAENLRASKYLETLMYDSPLWLFRLRAEPPPYETPVGGRTSPVGSLWEAEHWSVGRGIRSADAGASGGAVVFSRPGRRAHSTGRSRTGLPERELPCSGTFPGGAPGRSTGDDAGSEAGKLGTACLHGGRPAGFRSRRHPRSRSRFHAGDPREVFLQLS